MPHFQEHQPNYFPPPDLCTGQPLIEMAGIVKTFRNAAGEFTALNGVTACFYPGEFVSVVGKSGSGKSTLVNMITGIDHPTAGTVRVEDVFVHSMSESDMSIWRGKNLGIVFQFFQLLPTLTLLENVMLPMYLAGQYSPAERENRASDLLNLMGLKGLADKLPATISGGQQQSAAIARALANDPPILIADEPTGNLDSITADEVFDLFSGLIEKEKTILMVTHDIGLARRTTRTLLLSDGELINSWVASAMHELDHSQMLWLSHHLSPHYAAPGTRLTHLLAVSKWLILVTGGMVELTDPNGDELVIAQLAPGDYLVPQDLVHLGLAAVEMCASAGDPLEYMLADGPEYHQWLEENSGLGVIFAHRAAQRSTARQQSRSGDPPS